MNVAYNSFTRSWESVKEWSISEKKFFLSNSLNFFAPCLSPFELL